MLIFWLQMIATGWRAFTEALGSTTLGFWLQVCGLPFATLIFTAVVIGFREGKKQLKDYFSKNLLSRAIVIAIGVDLLIYGPILGIKILCATFQDHQSLVSRSQSAGEARIIQRQQDLAEWTPMKESLEAKLQSQALACAELGGENRTLHKQSTDQQTLIAGCQEDAIKRLSPEPQKLTVLTLEDVSAGEQHNETDILITNKEVTPVRITGSCDVHLDSISANPIGIGSFMGGADILNPEKPPLRYGQAQMPSAFQISFSNPAWTPVSPIRVKLTYRSLRSASCFYLVR